MQLFPHTRPQCKGAARRGLADPRATLLLSCRDVDGGCSNIPVQGAIPGPGPSMYKTGMGQVKLQDLGDVGVDV